ncbi:hypothetical protein GHK92_15530 [Nocardioides sp. dk4132]|uniref:hypothetical protein n=1 Tax=unclassified Nocardioides TaxID=2615069 RepID=UPI001296A066|nr:MULTISPECIES: hypothetical protein [unclassified Nocardioides]MQW77285.1 hypothetical protein [Nocardioides sp. dk4132]QGA08040.1 hypothetical protein GFH29_12005 [Nocardioides sp. dk884]
MMRLIRVELTRLRWRRAVVALVALAFVIPAAIGLARVWDTRPPSAQEQARIDQMIAEQTDRKSTQRQLAKCVADPDEWGVEPGDDPVASCEEWILPQPQWFGPPVLDLDQDREENGLVVILVLGGIALLAGATFAGHDWASGSMSNQLLFEPRRTRVWLAKAAAVTGTMFALAAVVATGWWLSLYAVARSRDLAIPDGLLREGLEQGLRGAALAAAAALLGFALTMLFRSTVATIGILFAVVLAGGLLMAALGLGGRWTPDNNLAAVVQNGTTYYVDVPPACDQAQVPAGVDCSGERDLSLAQGAGYLGVLTLGIGAASLGSHRRRDVP